MYLMALFIGPWDWPKSPSREGGAKPTLAPLGVAHWGTEQHPTVPEAKKEKEEKTAHRESPEKGADL